MSAGTTSQVWNIFVPVIHFLCIHKPIPPVNTTLTKDSLRYWFFPLLVLEPFLLQVFPTILPPSKQISFPFPRPTSHTLQKNSSLWNDDLMLLAHLLVWSNSGRAASSLRLQPDMANIPSFTLLLPSWGNIEGRQQVGRADRAGRGGFPQTKNRPPDACPTLASNTTSYHQSTSALHGRKNDTELWTF